MTIRKAQAQTFLKKLLETFYLQRFTTVDELCYDCCSVCKWTSNRDDDDDNNNNNNGYDINQKNMEIQGAAKLSPKVFRHFLSNRFEVYREILHTHYLFSAAENCQLAAFDIFLLLQSVEFFSRDN